MQQVPRQFVRHRKGLAPASVLSSEFNGASASLPPELPPEFDRLFRSPSREN
jgi:hypothetical protein